MPFDFTVAYVSAAGERSQEIARASKPPEQWTADDLTEVLRAAATHIGIEFPTALVDSVRTKDGVTLQIGSPAGGAALIGPLPIRAEAADEFVRRSAWFRYQRSSGTVH